MENLINCLCLLLLAVGVVQGAGVTETACKDGYYGTNCTLPCGKNCFGAQCSDSSNSTFLCTEGCVTGYTGQNCTLACSEKCEACDQYTQTCILFKQDQPSVMLARLGVPLIIIGVVIIVLIIVVIVYRKGGFQRCKKRSPRGEGEEVAPTLSKPVEAGVQESSPMKPSSDESDKQVETA